jgi:hypothetical protein
MERDIAPWLASWVVAGGLGQKDNTPGAYRKPKPGRNDDGNPDLPPQGAINRLNAQQVGDGLQRGGCRCDR